MTIRRSLIGLLVALSLAVPALAQEKSIIVASTTSTQDSGLFGHLLPLFKARTGIDVKVVALGTGQALDTARAAMPTSSSCMRSRRRKSSSPRASA